MATTNAGADAPEKTEKQIAAEALVALMAPGKAISQMSVSGDAAGEPTIIAIYLTQPVG
ncbi:hypothetical protein [Sphingomonas corticis]|jgi:hypothetical protein|uniref:Uncharacterized protein n=1 Tax=Sphingomonas corticis TaxID=2722791 RepID=A0ABX1CRD0_9SPHN|nr:hypothetical protein [Sphingomonas corticis]NJR80464.1 hypothetical protein [Sphingomonas corticis]